MNNFIKKYNEVFKLIENSHYILIVTDINLDVDTISSALALSNYMDTNNITHKIYNNAQNYPKKLDFLPRFNKIVNQLPKSYDLIIYLDCGNKSRVEFQFIENCKIINIDHHQSNNHYGDINIVNFYKGSTAEIFYDFFIANNLPITKDIATCLYVGIYDKSIAFTTPRTNRKTFEVIDALLSTGINVSYILEQLNMRESLAKYRLLPKILETLQLHLEGTIATIYQKEEWLKTTGATFNDCDEVINEILKISVVKIVIYLKEDKTDIRISFRGEDDTINLSEMTTFFHGAGDKNVAGATLKNSNIPTAMGKLLDTIKNYI